MTKISFSQSSIEKIEAAIKAAEAEVGAELVPIIVPRSDTYPELVSRGALLGGAVGAVVLLSRELISPEWTLPHTAYDLLFLLAMAGTGALLLWGLPRLGRPLLSPLRLSQAVACSARERMFTENLVGTKNRNAVLLYASLFERQLEVVADRKAAEKIPPMVWQKVAESFVSHAKKGDFESAILAAIKDCQAAMKIAGFRPSSNEADEITNSPKVEG